MSDESTSERKNSGISSDLLFKLLPWLYIVVSLVFGIGGRNTNLDEVIHQLNDQKTTINSLVERVGILSDRISKIEGSQESLRRGIDQDRDYRDKR